MVAKKAVKKQAPPKKKAVAKEKPTKDVKSASPKEDKKKPVAGAKIPATKAKAVPAPKTASAVSKAPAVKIDPNNPLGKKFNCYSCGTKFYDLHKPEKKCPKCGADQLAKPAIKSRMAAIRSSEYEVEEEEEPVLEDDELMEETEELEEAEEEEVAAEEEV